MHRLAVRRWVPSRSPNPMQTSYGWAQEKGSCAATLCRATASTNPATPGSPGHIWGCARAELSRASESTLAIPTRSMPPCWAIPTRTHQNGASTRRRTAVPHGTGCCLRAKRQVRSTWQWTQTIRKHYTRQCGKCIGDRIACGAAGRTRQCTKQPTAASPGLS